MYDLPTARCTKRLISDLIPYSFVRCRASWSPSQTTRNSEMEREHREGEWTAVSAALWHRDLRCYQVSVLQKKRGGGPYQWAFLPEQIAETGPRIGTGA
jgi:hypothetical protein